MVNFTDKILSERCQTQDSTYYDSTYIKFKTWQNYYTSVVIRTVVTFGGRKNKEVGETRNHLF